MTGPLPKSRVTMVFVLCATLVAGCSNSASQLLTTGSIFGGDAKPTAAVVKPATSVDRAIQVAAVSARAQKCGYVFDPAALRGAFLASETVPGFATPPAIAGDTAAAATPVAATPAADPTALAARYDYTARTIATKIAGEDNYCDASRTRIIKADLNRHLAGDYTPRKAKQAERGPSLVSDTPAQTELNPAWGYDTDAKPDRRVRN